MGISLSKRIELLLKKNVHGHALMYEPVGVLILSYAIRSDKRREQRLLRFRLLGEDLHLAIKFPRVGFVDRKFIGVKFHFTNIDDAVCPTYEQVDLGAAQFFSALMSPGCIFRMHAAYTKRVFYLWNMF